LIWALSSSAIARPAAAVREFRASLTGRNAQRITAGLDDRLHNAYTTRSS
jgi:hypothetical protein